MHEKKGHNCPDFHNVLEKIINIGDNEDFVALIPVGYADEQPVAPVRKPVEQVVTFLR